MADKVLTPVCLVLTDTVSVAALQAKIDAAIVAAMAAGAEARNILFGDINQVAVSTTITYSIVIKYMAFL